MSESRPRSPIVDLACVSRIGCVVSATEVLIHGLRAGQCLLRRFAKVLGNLSICLWRNDVVHPSVRPTSGTFTWDCDVDFDLLTAVDQVDDYLPVSAEHCVT